MVEEKAISITISLYPKHVEDVKRYAKYKKYNSESHAYQDIIADFFEPENKLIKYNFILFLIVPVIFCLLTTFANIGTEKVFNILIEQGFYFHELYLLSRVFTVLSFGSVGILIASVYWLRVKLKRFDEGK